MIRMLIVGYCYGIRFERRLCEEVEPHLAFRWFCRLDLDDSVPDHSTFSVNRHGRFRQSDFFRCVFEAVVRACMDAGLVKGQGFAVDPSVMEADASRYRGVSPEEADWSAPERQTRAVAEFLGAIDDDDPTADRKPPKVISFSDPCSAWTAKANKRVQFGYGLIPHCNAVPRARKRAACVSKRPKSREETPKEEGQQQREALPHRNKIRCVAQRARKNGLKDRPNLRQNRVARMLGRKSFLVPWN